MKYKYMSLYKITNTNNALKTLQNNISKSRFYKDFL